MRADEVDAKARALADAARNRVQAEGERERLEKAHAELVAATEAELEAERKLLEEGALRVADLSRNVLFRIGAEQRKAASAERVAAALDREKQARAEEEARRAELAQKKAEAEAIERDRERWEREEARRTVAREDEAAEEVFAARAHRISGGRPA